MPGDGFLNLHDAGRDAVGHSRGGADGRDGAEERDGADESRVTLRLWRLLNILTLIQGNPNLTSKDLARRQEVHRRTILRDIKTLNGAGIPIVHEGKGYKILSDFLMRPVHLNVEEAVALTVAGMALSEQGGAHYRHAAQSALDKLNAVLPAGVRNLAVEGASRIKVDLGAFESTAASEDLLPDLEDAIFDNKRCELLYFSMNRGEETRRKVDPYALLFREHAWYLVAYCHQRKDVILFRVDRIREMARLEESFEVPRSFSLADYMASAWEVERGNPVTVNIRFTAAVAPLIREARWHPSQELTEQPDGSLLMKVTTGGRNSLLRWILGFAGQAVVVEPADVREELVRMAEAAVGANG